MITGLILMIVGAVLIFWRKPLVKSTAAWQQSNFNIKYKPFDYKYGEVLYFIFGLILFAIGLLATIGVIKFK